jgi:hypothetical protein
MAVAEGSSKAIDYAMLAGRKSTSALAVACAILMISTAMTVSARTKTHQVQIRYVPPVNPAHEEIYRDMRERRALEKLEEFLSPYQLPRALEIRLEGCDGEADAWYGDDVITICYEYIQALWDNMPEETTPGGVEPFDTVAGPFFDTSLHEFAHALIDMFTLPVLGRLEDAADLMAAYIYLQMGPDEARRLFRGAAWAFFHEAEGEQPPPMTAFAGQHGTPAQRGYNILCIAYGADIELFGDIVSEGYLPAERAEFCEEEYEQIQDAYEELLGPHIDQALAKDVLKRSWLRAQ